VCTHILFHFKVSKNEFLILIGDALNIPLGILAKTCLELDKPVN
jgi:hypothetical protein